MAALTPVLTGFAADLFGLGAAFQCLTLLAALAALSSLALPGRPASPVPVVAGGSAPSGGRARVRARGTGVTR
jgi:hypothetical protein